MRDKIFSLLILGLMTTVQVSAREKSDVVWMTSGDRLTGEIKQLKHGKLRLATDSYGEVSIEWDDIAKVESEFAFQFERTDGTRVTGIISKTPDQQMIALQNQGQTKSFAHEAIVRILPVENTFWDRLQGSMSFGYSFTKASNVAQGNLGFRTTYRTEIRALTLAGSTIITSDQEDEGTQRSNLDFSVTRFRANKWFSSYLVGLESNDELGLDLRVSAGGGLGRYLLQNNFSELSVLGGLIGTAETLQPNETISTALSTQESVEGLLALEYSQYVYDHPVIDLSAKLKAFPSLTESGRTRAQMDLSLRWEVISDLFWDLSYYNSYDSDPPSASQSTSDYGVVTSIGYSF